MPPRRGQSGAIVEADVGRANENDDRRDNLEHAARPSGANGRSSALKRRRVGEKNSGDLFNKLAHNSKIESTEIDMQNIIAKLRHNIELVDLVKGVLKKT